MTKKITHEQLIQLIKIMYESPDIEGKKIPVMCYGTFGIGKSQGIKTSAKLLAKGRQREYLDWNTISYEDKRNIVDNNLLKDYFILFDIRLSEYDASDMRGLPDFDKLRKWVEWRSPFFVEILQHPDSDGILFFDEMNLAPDMTLKSCYKILHDKIINDVKINYNWLIVGAGNTEQDHASVSEMPAPLKDRVAEFELIPPSAKEWIKWAIRYGIHPKIIAYLTWKGTNLRKVNYEDGQKFTTERCLKGNSQILLANGKLKDIKDICIGDEVVGIENGKVITSEVLKTFRKEVDRQYKIKTSTKEITSSGEHGFLTDIGYVQAKNLNKKFTTNLYGIHLQEMETIGKKLSEKESAYDKRTISKKTKSISQFNNKPIKFSEHKEIEDCSKRIFETDNDGFELLSRFIRWGRKYLLFKASAQKEKESFILRTSTNDRQLFCFIQGLVYQYRISNKGRKKTKPKMARQIQSSNIWYEDKMVIRIISALLKDKKSCSFIDDRIFERDRKARKEEQNKINEYSKSNKIVKYKSKEKIISIRKKDNKEVFYDLMTSTQNYIANGFIVHNCWERVSCIMNRPFEDIELSTGTLIGEGIAVEFVNFLKIQDKINLDDIVKNPAKVKMVTEVGEKYFVVSGLAEKYANNTMTFEQMFAISQELYQNKSGDFVALLWRLCSRMAKAKFRKEFTSKELSHPLRGIFIKFLTED